MAMDASDVSVTATKIDVLSTDGVLVNFDEVVTAVNLDTPGTITIAGTGPYTYTITAANYRELEISSGCIINFEEGDTINWIWSASSSTIVVFEIASGAVVTIEPNVTFDFGSNSQTYMRAYFYCYGSCTAEATLGNEIIFKHYRSIYMYPYQAQSFAYCNFEDQTYNGYALYFSNVGTQAWAQCDMDHITVSGSTGYVYFATGGMIPTNLNLTNWVIDGGSTGLQIFGYPGVYFDSWTIKNASSYPSVNGSGLQAGQTWYNTPGVLAENSYQPYVYFDNCLFEDNDAGIYNYVTYYHSVTVFDNCEFKGTGTRIYANYYATMFLINPTYTNTNVNPVTFGSLGNVFIADHLTLNITYKGNPVEGASVTIVQSEGHIVINGVTDSNGKVLNPYGKETVLPISQQTSTAVYDLWADSIAGGRYYTISVFKEGVGSYSEDFTFSSANTKNISLKTYVELDPGITKQITHKIINGV